MGDERDERSVPQGEGAEPDFDARLARLEEIVSGLEGGGLALEPSIERYREGVELLKSCRALLGGYRKQVEELTRDAEAGLTPYAGDPDVSAGERGDPDVSDAERQE